MDKLESVVQHFQVHAQASVQSKKGRSLIFGVAMPSPKKTRKGDQETAASPAKKPDKSKKEKKDKKVKKDADDKCPVYRLTDATIQAARGARALATIISKVVPNVSFNRMKLIFNSGSGMSGMNGITAPSSETTGQTLICAGSSSASDIRVWSYVRGIDQQAASESSQSCKMQWAKVDPRLPWTFQSSPDWALVAELWGGKRWLRHADAKGQREHLRGLGFVCAASSSMLDPLPEALASGKLLMGMAVKAYRKDFPRAEKAGWPKHALSLLSPEAVMCRHPGVPSVCTARATSAQRSSRSLESRFRSRRTSMPGHCLPCRSRMRA